MCNRCVISVVQYNMCLITSCTRLSISFHRLAQQSQTVTGQRERTRVYLTLRGRSLRLNFWTKIIVRMIIRVYLSLFLSKITWWPPPRMVDIINKARRFELVRSPLKKESFEQQKLFILICDTVFSPYFHDYFVQNSVTNQTDLVQNCNINV